MDNSLQSILTVAGKGSLLSFVWLPKVPKGVLPAQVQDALSVLLKLHHWRSDCHRCGKEATTESGERRSHQRLRASAAEACLRTSGTTLQEIRCHHRQGEGGSPAWFPWPTGRLPRLGAYSVMRISAAHEHCLWIVCQHEHKRMLDPVPAGPAESAWDGMVVAEYCEKHPEMFGLHW